MMNWKERIGRIATLGGFDKITGIVDAPDDSNIYVAAGNPGIVVHDYPIPVDIPQRFMMGGKTCFKDDYICNTVFGNSMLVDGIHSGWGLLMKPAGNKRIKSGDFIVINVDGGYYRYRHQDKTPLFQKKLRRAIGEIKSDSSVESIFSMLSGTFAEPLDSRDREDLTDSLNDARTYYADSKTLFLSVTYHDSDIHYSFHPSGSIKYWVEGVAFRNDKGIEYKTTEELQ